MGRLPFLHWRSHALAGCGRRCATLSRWTGSLCAADSTARHLASQTHRGLNLVFGSDSRLRISLRPRGLRASMRHPVCTGQRGVSTRHRDGVTSSCFRSKIFSTESARSRFSSAHSRSEYRTESTMKLASPSFTGVFPGCPAHSGLWCGDRQWLDLELSTVLY